MKTIKVELKFVFTCPICHKEQIRDIGQFGIITGWCNNGFHGSVGGYKEHEIKIKYPTYKKVCQLEKFNKKIFQ